MINQENINIFLDKYIPFVDSLSNKYNYDNNIKHLLYFIVPSFIIKYGVSSEKLILSVFSETPVIISSTSSDIVHAYFARNIKYVDGRINVSKYIVLDTKKSSSFPDLLDSVVHEYLHAVNSYNNEVNITDKYVKLRTGVSYLIYDKDSLKFINKSRENILEEILNTLNTEEIINIIKSFSKYKINNSEFENMVYALNSETSLSYKSNAYNFEKYICDVLVKNKGFTSTINNLRFKGFIDDIPNLFDSVIGKDGSYDELNNNLILIHDLELKYSSSKFFKKRILNKVRSVALKVIDLINLYDSKCIYK